MKLGTPLSLATIALCGALLAPAPAVAAVDSFFDIFTELPVQAPPYPSAPIITISGVNFGGGMIPTQQIETEMIALSLNGLPPGVPVLGHGGGGGAGGGAPSIDSFFDVFVDIDLPPTPTNGRSIRDVRIVHPPGTPPGTWRLVPIDPGAPPGSVDSFFDITYDLSFFDITYRVADATGEHTYHTHGTSPSGRMSFFDVFVELRNPTPYPDGTVDSFFDIFVDFEISGPRNSGADCRSHTTGTYEGGATPAARNSWGAIKALYR